MNRWLVTGGAGYIGAHVVRALLNTDHEVIVLDDLSTGIKSNIPASCDFFEVSLLEQDKLDEIFSKIDVMGVIHLAAKKSVEESVMKPDFYHEQNVVGLLNLLRSMKKFSVNKIVYSSSAAVYGENSGGLVTEASPTIPTSPYGETKLKGELLLKQARDKYNLNYISLRYFNVIGAANNKLGDTSSENLLPKVFARIQKGLSPVIYGNDYKTIDGTCVRDYIDVRDLAEAHVLAAEYLSSYKDSHIFNVGTGLGSSVLQVIQEISQVSKKNIVPEFAERRSGDPATLVADSSLISKVLNWRPIYSLKESVETSWRASQRS